MSSLARQKPPLRELPGSMKLYWLTGLRRRLPTLAFVIALLLLFSWDSARNAESGTTCSLGYEAGTGCETAPLAWLAGSDVGKQRWRFSSTWLGRIAR